MSIPRRSPALLLVLVILGTGCIHIGESDVAGMDAGPMVDSGVDAATPDAGARDDAAAEAVCGDGIVQPSELCDPMVDWTYECPEGWGACVRCAHDCQTKMYPVNLDCSTARREVEYDGRANLTLQRHRDAEGNIVLEERREYDERGNMLHVVVGVETVESELIQTFDAQNRRLTHWRDDDGDGDAEYATRDEYEGRTQTTYTDIDGDGEDDTVDFARSDEWGRRIETWHDAIEDDRRRRVSTFVIEWAYDGDVEGHLQEVSTLTADTDGDGRDDWINTSTYDAETRTLRHEFDSDGDGDLDNWYTYEYDALDREVRFRSVDNGVVTELRESEYDEDGRRNTVRYRDEGYTLYIREEVAPFGEVGLVRVEEQYDEDGGLSWRREHRIDALGNGIEERNFDENAFIVIHEFDALTNHPIRVSQVLNNEVTETRELGCHAALMESLPFMPSNGRAE